MADFSGGIADGPRGRRRGPGGALTSPFRGFGRFIVWLSTANVDVLDEIPTDRPKYVGLGAAVFITSAMAGVSAAFAVHMGLRVPVAACVLIGACWSLAIMNLDRWLVATAGRGWGLVMLLPRLLLALLIGVVVSTPITLAIFAPEIKSEIGVIHAEQEANFVQQSTTDKRGARITALQKEIATLSQGVAPFNPADYPDVVAAKKNLDEANKTLADDTKGLQCETNGGTGCPGGVGGTGRQGYGQVAQAYRDKIDNVDKPAVTSAQLAYNGQGVFGAKSDPNGGALGAAQRQYNANAQTVGTTDAARLATDKKELATLQAGVAADNANFLKDTSDNNGLLIRIEALNRLSRTDATMGATHWLLFAFFTMIECLPIFVKFLMSVGRKNKYEVALEEREKAELAVSVANSNEYRAAHQVGGGSLLAQAQAERERRDDAIEHLTGIAIDYQTRLAEQALDGWFANQQGRVDRDPEGFLRDGGDPLPPIVTPRGPGRGRADDVVGAERERFPEDADYDPPSWSSGARRWLRQAFGGGERDYIEQRDMYPAAGRPSYADGPGGSHGGGPASRGYEDRGYRNPNAVPKTRTMPDPLGEPASDAWPDTD